MRLARASIGACRSTSSAPSSWAGSRNWPGCAPPSPAPAAGEAVRRPGRRGGRRRQEPAAARRRSAASAPTSGVLTGGCIELGGEGLPLVPLVEALRTLVRTTPDAELDRFLGPARRELARLLPELAPDDVAPPPPDRGQHRAAVRARARACSAGSGRTGRWSSSSRTCTGPTAPRWTWSPSSSGRCRAPACCWCSPTAPTRSTAARPLRPLLSGWERLRGVERVQLERFNRAEVAAQVGAIVGAPPTGGPGRPHLRPVRGQRLLRRGARPHRARRRAASTELPPSLRDVLLSRAEQLSGPAQRLLRTAAVAGRWVPERLLAEVAAVPGRPSCTRRCARRSTPRCCSSTAPAAATPSGTR